MREILHVSIWATFVAQIFNYIYFGAVNEAQIFILKSNLNLFV